MSPAEGPPSVLVVRAVVDGPDRSAVDYLAADGKWTCEAHPRAADCAHLAALRDHVATAVLKKPAGGDRP